MKTFIATFFLWCVLLVSAVAHEVRPAYLELRETAPDNYDVLWKVPAAGELRMGLYVRLPADVRQIAEPRGMFSGGAHIERWRMQRTGGMAGQTIVIEGLSSTKVDTLVRVTDLNGVTQTFRATPDVPSVTIAAVASRWQVTRTYTALGIEHILSGIDHLLFVLTLIIITRGGWKLVKTVTAFTISHSLTLTAAALGWVHVPQKPVEAVIALSIVFVAVEILRQRRGLEGLTARAPWVVAFCFGLMHGLGFASGLSEAGLPVAHIPTALLFFSLGVETGHFLFIGVVVALVALVQRLRLPAPRWAPLLPPYAIGALAMFWIIERTLAF